MLVWPVNRSVCPARGWRRAGAGRGDRAGTRRGGGTSGTPLPELPRPLPGREGGTCGGGASRVALPGSEVAQDPDKSQVALPGGPDTPQVSLAGSQVSPSHDTPPRCPWQGHRCPQVLTPPPGVPGRVTGDPRSCLPSRCPQQGQNCPRWGVAQGPSLPPSVPGGDRGGPRSCPLSREVTPGPDTLQVSLAGSQVALPGLEVAQSPVNPSQVSPAGSELSLLGGGPRCPCQEVAPGVPKVSLPGGGPRSSPDVPRVSPRCPQGVPKVSPRGSEAAAPAGPSRRCSRRKEGKEGKKEKKKTKNKKTKKGKKEEKGRRKRREGSSSGRATPTPAGPRRTPRAAAPAG
ncbi:uncharacterized protein LOC130248366 [Oenanthe melanoleuca]|uniref:uncharacterized protein LOC130248366 n=1 Tax=Oenanthe melanoleuca TaxID=2939378 RepID=UPI0024C1679D|nr:uncharacterized protein LOC130248366 [Oenanthe melanoleuca]